MATPSKEERPLIVIKKIKKGGHGHHGGAWKIAYADFVTAMMAFFLLMWLLGSSTQGDLKGISDFFNTPLKVALMGGKGTGGSSSVTEGGGKDITRSAGQVRRNPAEEHKPLSLKNAEFEVQKADAKKLEKVKQEIEQRMDVSTTMKQFKEQIKLDITQEGLRIQIVDDQNRPMFDSGRAELKDYMKNILNEITKVLNDVENKLTISGHTDAMPYSNGERGYSNWELSADRANACRRQMLSAGLDDRKMLRVVGLASSLPLIQDDPMDPTNRRITIIVMNKRAEQAFLTQTINDAP
ncbi:MAG: flagellar motor protein MotB [Burkholderiaceae bacterium]